MKHANKPLAALILCIAAGVGLPLIGADGNDAWFGSALGVAAGAVIVFAAWRGAEGMMAPHRLARQTRRVHARDGNRKA